MLQGCHIHNEPPKKPIYSKTQAKSQNLARKFQIFKFHRVFGLWKKKMTFPTYTVSKKQERNVSKWQFLIFSGGKHPLPNGLIAYPTPG